MHRTFDEMNRELVFDAHGFKVVPVLELRVTTYAAAIGETPNSMLTAHKDGRRVIGEAVRAPHDLACNTLASRFWKQGYTVSNWDLTEGSEADVSRAVVYERRPLE